MALASTHPAAAGTLRGPPDRGDCRWVHGRFAVYNGSGVQRIWIIGTKRIVAIPDDFPEIPKVIRDYEARGPFLSLNDALFADFELCALEDSKPGHMQHVKVKAVRNAIFRGEPFRNTNAH